MRAFLVLSVIAVASAGRLDGYNYQLGGGIGVGDGSIGSIGSGIGGGLGVSKGSGISIVSAGSGLSSGIGIGSGLSAGSGLGIGSGIGGGLGVGGGSIGSGIGDGSGIGGGLGFGSGSIGSSGSIGLSGGQIIDGGLNKEYFVYSAPEEDVYNGQGSQPIAAAIKRNLRVVFIKTPENNEVSNAALQLAKQANEDRTAIYVLSKEPDVSDLANQIQELRDSIRQKPEVRFIKYRTPQDAVNAQLSIQQQYDALGGLSKSSDEGIAPVLNYASASEQIGRAVELGNSGSASNLSPSGVIGGGGRREYLPPVVY